MDEPCFAIYGMRGSGKSTFAKKLIRREKRLIVCAPSQEYARDCGMTLCRSRLEVRREIAQTPLKFRLAYVPEGDHVRNLHHLAEGVWKMQSGYEAGEHRIPVCLLVDEANLFFPSRQLPSDQQAMLKLALQGRHRGVKVILVTQRPALVNKDFRQQCELNYAFRLADEEDRQIVLRRDRMKDWSTELSGLPTHNYLEITPQSVTRKNTRLK